jgi:HK97 family phage prohead protease
MDKQFLNFTVDVKEHDPEKRVISFRGSTGDIDRCNEVVEPKGWKLDNYQKNPVFLWAHNYSSPPIGKAVRVKKGKDGLDFDIQFATAEEYPFADTIFKLYQGGYLKSVSVGFIPLEWEDHKWEDGKERPKPDRTILKQELLELSAVSVPANPNALMNALQCGLITDAEKKDFEFAAAREEQYAQDKGLQSPALEPTAEKKNSCEIVDETTPTPSATVPEVKATLTVSPKHDMPVPCLPELAEYDRGKAFNRLVTWAGIIDDKLPDLTKEGFDELTEDKKEGIVKLSTAFAYADIHNLRYMHHDVENGSLVTNLAGVTSSMKRLLEDVYHGTISITQGKEPHAHLANHYIEYKRIAPSFNLFKLEAIRELFTGDSEQKPLSFPDADIAATEKEEANDADVLVAIMNGLAPEGDITEKDLNDVSDLLESTMKEKKR